MAGDAESQQQPPPKATVAAPAITSAFIHKGAKTFAPRKAVRRRPPASAASQTPAPASSAPSSSQAQPVTTAPSVELPSNQPANVSGLPTPAPTQVSRNEAPQTEQTVPCRLDDLAQTPSATPASPTENALGSQQKQRKLGEPVEDATRESSQANSLEQPVPSAQDALIHIPSQDAPPTIQQIVTPTAEQSTERLADPVTGSSQFIGPVTPAEATYHPAPADLDSPTTQNNVSIEKSAAPQDAAESSEGDGTWNAVNSKSDAGTNPITVSRYSKPSGRRRRKPIAHSDVDVEEDGTTLTALGKAGDGSAGNGLGPSSRAKSGARDVEKVSVPEIPSDDGRSAKESRQSRRVNSNSVVRVEEELNVESETLARDTESAHENEEQQSVEDGVTRRIDASITRHRQPTRKRKRQSTSQRLPEQGNQQLKRRGRQPRAPTPSDAENDVIDEDDVFMGDLARRDVRRGKLSQRERKMRTINWEEVRQRQKEKEAEQMNSRALQEKMLQEEQEREDAARTVQEQVRYEIVDGQTRIVQGSGQVDHERLAEARFTETVVEEDDFTNRINARSFMRNNKRYPEEFLLPGQGKRWDVRSTADFYDAMRMFGTDFGMMTSLFDGVSRRSLKLKFTREEKRNPEIIKEILQQKDTRLKDWDEYLKASGKQSAEYDKVERIKRDLEEAEEEGRRLIQEAKAAYEDEMRQKRLAGVASEEEENGEKATTNKKKKGKKGKGKEVNFQDEEGVEILEVAEDDGWGQE